MPRRVHTTPAPVVEEAPEVVVSNDVVVERWEQGPLLERVAAQLHGGVQGGGGRGVRRGVYSG